MPCGGHPSQTLIDACSPTSNFWKSMVEDFEILELVSGMSKRDAIQKLIQHGAAPVRDTSPPLICVEEHHSAQVTAIDRVTASMKWLHSVARLRPLRSGA